VIKAKTTQYFRRGKPAQRSGLVNQDDYTIIATYGAEYRGLVQYYLLAGNVYWFNRVEWAMSSSMLKTLASKHRSSVVKMAARHRTHIDTPRGRRTCYEAQIHRPGRKPLVARFGGIPLTRRKTAVLDDRQPSRVGYPHKEIISRLCRGTCELSGSPDDIGVHQVRALADLARAEPGSAWAAVMTRKRRKTLVVYQLTKSFKSRQTGIAVRVHHPSRTPAGSGENSIQNARTSGPTSHKSTPPHIFVPSVAGGREAPLTGATRSGSPQARRGEVTGR
jgi:hypothetical protein